MTVAWPAQLLIVHHVPSVVAACKEHQNDFASLGDCEAEFVNTRVLPCVFAAVVASFVAAVWLRAQGGASSVAAERSVLAAGTGRLNQQFPGPRHGRRCIEGTQTPAPTPCPEHRPPDEHRNTDPGAPSQ